MHVAPSKYTATLTHRDTNRALLLSQLKPHALGESGHSILGARVKHEPTSGGHAMAGHATGGKYTHH